MFYRLIFNNKMIKNILIFFTLVIAIYLLVQSVKGVSVVLACAAGTCCDECRPSSEWPYGCWWEHVCNDLPVVRCNPGDPGCDCGGCEWGPTGCYCCDPVANPFCGASPTSAPTSPPPEPTTPPAPTATPVPPRVAVSGRVYDDPTGLSGGLGKCTGPLGSPVKPGGGSTVRVNPDGLTGAVQGNGTYSVASVLEAGAKDILIQGMDATYQCTCPTGCQYSAVNVASGNNSGWDFFVSQVRPKWLKVLGGSVHSQGNLTSNVPSGNVYIADFSGDGPGILTKRSGSVVNLGSGTLSSQPSWNYNDLMSANNWKYGYQAMWLRAGNPATDPGDGSSAPAAGVYKKVGNYSISGSWTNLAGSRVIFVQGDVTINANITLANGAFFAIVASGNITVNPAVGNIPPKAVPTSADAALSGAFFADGSFIGGTTGAQNDKQLVIYGSVAADADLNGIGAVSSQRDLGGLNATPGVAFIWNPNLILNAPQQFTDAVMDWREVAP